MIIQQKSTQEENHQYTYQNQIIERLQNYHEQLQFQQQNIIKESGSQLPIPKFKKQQLDTRLEDHGIVTLKSNLFRFQNNKTQTLVSVSKFFEELQNNNNKEKINVNTIKFSNAMKPSHLPIKQAYLWKPKIQEKKLYEEPKFFLSMQRKKIRGQINVLSASIPQPKKLGQMKGKVLSKGKLNKNHVNRIMYKTSNVSNYPKDERSQQKILQQSYQMKQKNSKTPNLHFNMHHVLNKRRQNYFFENQELKSNKQKQSKAFKNSFIFQNLKSRIKAKRSSLQAKRSKSLVQGSNQPYYTFFKSFKYQTSTPRVTSKSFYSLDNNRQKSNRKNNQQSRSNIRVKSAIRGQDKNQPGSNIFYSNTDYPQGNKSSIH